MILRPTFILCLLLLLSTTLFGGVFDPWTGPGVTIANGPVTVPTNIGLYDFWSVSHNGQFRQLNPQANSTDINVLAGLLGSTETDLEAAIGGGLSKGQTAVSYLGFKSDTSFNLDFSYAYSYISADFGNNIDTGFVAWSDADGLHVDALVCDFGCMNSVDPIDGVPFDGPRGVLPWTSSTFSQTGLFAVAFGVTSSLTDSNDSNRIASNLFLADNADGNLSAVPEPFTLATLGAGLVVIGLLRRRRA